MTIKQQDIETPVDERRDPEAGPRGLHVDLSIAAASNSTEDVQQAIDKAVAQLAAKFGSR